MTDVVATGSVLSEAAAWVSRMCPAKPSIPVLGGLMLEVDSGELRMTAYDYETAASVRIPAIGQTLGRMLVSGRLLAAVAKTVARDVNVTLSDDGGTVRVLCGKSEWTLPSMPVAEYPSVPGGEEPKSEVRGEDLRRALSRVLPAVDRKGSIPTLAGIEVSAEDDRLTLTATDRFRLATAEVPWKPVAELPATIVPWSLLDDAARAVTGSEAVRLGVVDGSFAVATETHTLTGRTIAGPFPAWQRLMPVGEAPAVAVVEAAGLAQAAEQALVVLDATRSLRLDFGPGGVEVSAAADGQNARAEAPVVSYRGEAMSIAVNPQYLRDALTAAGSALVEIRLGVNASRPILVLPMTPDGGAVDPYRHLLMPVKLA